MNKKQIGFFLIGTTFFCPVVLRQVKRIKTIEETSLSMITFMLTVS